ncbi:hypothetical protein [Nocardia terpenica]|uniref:hypothetical protein n=1 Tax=Nocardia terpenica TaxID=455432 RepID=UPI0015835E99|nr:hypothetical protein [Nocardia terpenica]
MATPTGKSLLPEHRRRDFWGDDPADHLLTAAKVALTAGHPCGSAGKGFARLNFGCSPQTVTEAVHRIAAAR